MKDEQSRKLERRFGLYRGKRKVRSQEEIIKALLKKAAQQEKAKAFKKAVKDEDVAKDTAEERAAQEINALLRLSKGSLIKILPVVETRVRDGRYPKIVLEVLIERIRRNQWNKLSIEDQIRVNGAEASLLEQTV